MRLRSSPWTIRGVYNRLLSCLDQLIDGLNPVSIVTDFEMATLKAFKGHYPTVSLTGCMFHFGQCVWRKLQGEGLAVRYNSEPDFALKVKQLLALALVPVTDVIIV